MKCETCDTERPMWAWTDTHGIAQCMRCGTPYRLYHYEGEEGNERRVEKPPELCVKLEYIPVLREYWNQTHRIIPSGFSFPGGQELASNKDHEDFSEWMKQNAEKYLSPTPSSRKE